MLNAFSNMTADATFGAAATAWNDKIVAARAYTVSNTADVTTDYSAPVTGQTFTLTTGIDSKVGGSGNDTFTASDAVAAATWTALDAIDGGEGTDTLNVSTVTAIANSAITGATVTNIENINLVSSSTVSLTTTTGFSGLTDLTAVGVGTITLVAAAGTNVTATDAAQGAAAISITGGKKVTLTTSATDSGDATVDVGSVTIGSSTAKPVDAITATITKTQTIAANKGNNITITGGAGVTLNTTSNSGVAIAAASSTPTDDTAGVITVTPTSGAVVINSTAKNTSLTAVIVNAPSITVAGGTAVAGSSTVAITQAADTTQSATGISTVVLGAVSVIGGTSTTSVSVSQTAADAVGAIAVTAAAATPAVAGTPVVTLVTASPGVTGVTAVTAVNKAAANPAAAGTPKVTSGAVTIADGNQGSSTVANTISAVTLANYGDSTITSTALNTLTLSGNTVATGGSLGITEGGSTATVAANKTLTMNLGGGKLGAITDSSAQFSTVNVNLTVATTLSSFTDSALRTLNIAGTGVLSVTTMNTAVTALTVADAAGFSGDISSNTGITSFNGSGTTAANTVTINAASQTYSGGAGVDTVTIAADAAVTISGGDGANVLKMTTAVTPTTTGMKAKVSGFQKLSVSSTSGSIDMSKMPTDITTVESTAASGGITLTKVVDGTALNLTAMNSSAASTSYTLANTGGASKSVTVTLGGATTDSLNFGTVVLADINGNGIGTVSLVSNGVNITALDATPNYNTVALTDTGISTLNVSGTQGLVIGATSYTDAVTGLTINNTNTSSYGVTIPLLIDTALDTLTFTGSGNTSITALDDGAIANVTITNSGTGTVSIGQIHQDSIGTDTTALTSLTLLGNVVLGAGGLPLTGTIAPVQIDTSSAAVTVSGATDHAGVALIFGANANATTVTLGDGNNYVRTTSTTGGGNITTGSGMDWVQQGSLSTALKSSLVSTGAGMDTIVTGVGFSVTVTTKAAGGDGADYIQVQTTSTTYNPTHGGTNGKYGSVVWTGSQTTGSNITAGSWNGTLYSESSDTITSSGVIQPTFKSLMSGSLVNAAGAGKIFADANIVAPMYGEGAVLVASTAKDVFLFQTENTLANDSTTAKGVSAGGSIVQNFKIGTDVIAVTNFQGSGDNLFVGTAAAVTAINAVTASEALLASTHGWSWAFDANTTTAGVLSYVGNQTDLTSTNGGANPAYANMTIHLVGVQGTIVSADSFFYQG